MSLPVHSAVQKEAQPSDWFGVNVKLSHYPPRLSFHFLAFSLGAVRGLSPAKIHATSVLASFILKTCSASVAVRESGIPLMNEFSSLDLY
jgi:hypothetical protein